MSQAFLPGYSLLSPQQLMQARQQAPIAAPVKPLIDPTLLSRFSRISALVSPDQVSIQQPPAPVKLSNPLSLFKSSVSLALKPPSASRPALGMGDLRQRASVDALKTMSPATLKELGQRDKAAFFAALLPAAIESERAFGVPAELTLAQAALESGWARSPIGGYNIFGIKGSGPAGKTSVDTKEFLKGQWVQIKDGFAKYHNFYEATKEHGELFHNGYYDKAVKQFATDRSTYAFIDNIQGIYATDPKYSQKIKSIIEDHGLTEMVNRTGMV